MLELRDIFANVTGVSLSGIVSMNNASTHLTNLRLDNVE